RLLGRLLRLRLLDSRVVNQEGQPLARPAEPLRWELTPAASPEEDYRLRLVQADGSPPPPILAVLPGNPALYLTEQAVFTGPNPQPHVLQPTQENRIPAPAIERSAGVAFLQSLGVALPPRVRERVRTLPYQVTIQCALRPIYPGSTTEDCVVDVRAVAPDGHQQTWTGHHWMNADGKPGRRREREDEVITLYDSAMLASVPTVLEPLNLKSASFGTHLATRVTKKFPDVFANWLKTVPPHIQLQLEGDLASFTNADVAGRVQLDVTEADIDWFDLRVVLNVSDTTLSKEEIKLLLNARGGYVRLAGKGWRRLQYDLSEEENDRLARLGLSPRELSAEPQRLHALQLADEAAKKFLPEQQVEQIARRASELKARVAPDLPAGVQAELRPYQLEGFHFLAYLATNRFGGILADDMGLGKTLQTLAWLVWLREQPPANGQPAAPTGGPAPSLVVCPKSVMDNWHAEATRFTPGLRVRVWSSGDSAQLTEQLASADVHVLNYSQLRSLGESLVPIRWLAVVLDEGQYIKNPNSQTAQVARALRAERRLVLSGTPIENRLLDLWSLMAFAMPGVLGSRAQFAKLYDAKGDPMARRRLAARVRPFVLRRTKAQVAKDLPDRIEEDLFCEMEGEQKTLYRAELKRAQQLLLKIQTQKELAQAQFHFLTSLLRLRQACCHPRLMKPDSKAASAKVEALLEQLEPLMEDGQKVLVFSQFVELLELLRPALEERGWPIFYLTGATENRGDLVRQFQSAEGAAVFLISLKAGGFGLNLTAASYVVLFDPWWNPAVENQAIDRTHRIGQANKVIAYRLLIKHSIEEKIRELQKQKKALAEDVLGEEKFAQSLTLSDLHFLFAD
ncbi:MAG TPA: DEAD/DEAH box helicase, partial [Candidatus Sulfotelmatobacter sp.]|nr:DEAD/DEAH box helicase [Candidatus Sulfotelmatobacter sp.]